MKLYADSPSHRARQILADLSVLVFCLLCVWGAVEVHARLDSLANPSRQVTASASELGQSLRDAGSSVGDIPLVPDGISAPFDTGADAADAMAVAGAKTSHGIERLATLLSILIGGLPILLALGWFLPGRFRWIRNATSGRRLLDSQDDLDLFALRALARQPLHVLAKVSDDPAGAWRRGDPQLVMELAMLELRDCGLDPRRRLPA